MITISIIVFSILLLVIVATISYGQMKPTFKNIEQLKATIEQKKQFYNRESQYLTKKANKLNGEVHFLQKNLDNKKINIQYFSQTQEKLQDSLLYLKDHLGDYSKGIAKNFTSEIKEDGPKIIKVLKRSFKKTFRKQKERYIND